MPTCIAHHRRPPPDMITMMMMSPSERIRHSSIGLRGMGSPIAKTYRHHHDMSTSNYGHSPTSSHKCRRLRHIHHIHHAHGDSGDHHRYDDGDVESYHISRRFSRVLHFDDDSDDDDDEYNSSSEIDESSRAGDCLSVSVVQQEDTRGTKLTHCVTQQSVTSAESQQSLTIADYYCTTRWQRALLLELHQYFEMHEHRFNY